MNKQELIEKYKELENSSFDIAAIVVCQLVLKDLEQLDEPKPVKVKQFVADWYEENKDSFEFNVWDWIAFRDEAKNQKIESLIIGLITPEKILFKPSSTCTTSATRSKKEKRYLVKVKGVHFTNYLISGNRKDIWFFHSAYEPEHQIIAHTRKELEEAGFGWVFDCPGIEIEEVE